MGLGAVVVAHDGLDGLTGLIGVVEGDIADIVVQDVGLNDTVEDVTTDKAEVTVDGGSGATGKVPHLGLIVGEGGVSVLQEGNGNYEKMLVILIPRYNKIGADCVQIRSDGKKNLPSQWLTQRYGIPYHTSRLIQP